MNARSHISAQTRICNPSGHMATKRRRIATEHGDALRQLAGSRVSQMSLAEILGKLRASGSGVTVPVNRASVSDAVLRQFDGMSHSETLQLREGGEFCWEMVDPAMLITESVRRDPMVAAAYTRALRESPPSQGPWDIVVGCECCKIELKLYIISRPRPVCTSS